MLLSAARLEAALSAFKYKYKVAGSAKGYFTLRCLKHFVRYLPTKVQGRVESGGGRGGLRYPPYFARGYCVKMLSVKTS